MSGEVLLLSRAELSVLMTPADYLAAVEQAFRASAAGEAHAPEPMHIAAEQGAFHAKGARFGCYVALKLNGNFPGNPTRGLPTIQGVVLLADAESGAPLAILDSIEITVRRTAAATALAARYLARPESATLAVCGCGAQALPHLEALAAVLPIKRVRAWDMNSMATARFVLKAGERAGLDVQPVEALRDATLDADIIVTSTTSRTAFLTPADVSAGAFIAAVGADNPHKNEIAPTLMARAKVVADVLSQCRVMGDLHHAIEAGAMRAEDAHAELAEVVAGAKPGRVNAEEIIVFDSTGTAIQDVTSAALAYERARESGRGVRFALT